MVEETTKVLVVEDEPDIRELLVDILEDAGYEVSQAMDGGTALEKVRDYPPDIILLDVSMPVMDGFQVLERLQKEPATRSIPVIMVTAKGHQQDVIKARTGGAWGYVTKPWEAEEIESKVAAAETVVRQRRRPEEEPRE